MSVRKETIVSCDNRGCTNNLPFGDITEGEALLYAQSKYNWAEQSDGNIYCPECDEMENSRIKVEKT